MKKLSRKQREIDVKNGIKHRQGMTKSKKRKSINYSNGSEVNDWIDSHREKGLNVEINKNRVTIILPERLNFFHDYKLTVLHLNAIRKLITNKSTSHKTYKLDKVKFDYLKSVSTSASLVLTAELSKWDDAVRNNLKPNIKNWNPDILVNFNELGFFDLFKNKPSNISQFESNASHNRKIIKYTKGRCGDNEQTRVLKENITNIIGDEIKKWRFLHSGLSEAIVNVTHHAYPKEYGFSEIDRNWYYTASYNTTKKELKVVFYDQGIGIPKSLPASDLWEKLLEFLSIFPLADRKKDEVLLKAAVELDRTRTEDSDRGKGLQDLMEFIRQRGDGYLSILSLKGLYKLQINNGIESIKSERFDYPVHGTLIIWCVTV
ncbi:hypothetical protein [Nitrosomonas communis]|uniref:hypothetical protein n=1 Tax=Nitrosomonas communis TaxID=44574 RepID=UPI0026E9F145|nr:hypothetical protein [Nitrosomonas communis]MCO6428076.1 hypothetical protein [Nitrosomonas communis]